MKIIFLSLFLGMGALGAELDALKARNEVRFVAIGQPSAMRIKGTLKEGVDAVSGKILFEKSKATGKLTLKLDALDTGIELRTRHMKEKYLETAKFPEAEFEFTCPISNEKTAPLEGKLTLHGKTSPVSDGHCSASEKDGKVTLSFKVKVQDFGIVTPSYLGIRVTEEVLVEAITEKKPS